MVSQCTEASQRCIAQNFAEAWKWECMFFMSIRCHLAVMTLLSGAGPGSRAVTPTALRRPGWRVRRSASQLPVSLGGLENLSPVLHRTQTPPLQSKDNEIDQREGMLPTGPGLENKDALDCIFEVFKEVRLSSGYGVLLGSYAGHVLWKISGQEPTLGARSWKQTQVSMSQTDRGRENVGETEHGIDVEPGAMCGFSRLHLKASFSKSCP